MEVKYSSYAKKFNRLALITLAVGQLVACGGGGGSPVAISSNGGSPSDNSNSGSNSNNSNSNSNSNSTTPSNVGSDAILANGCPDTTNAASLVDAATTNTVWLLRTCTQTSSTTSTLATYASKSEPIITRVANTAGTTPATLYSINIPAIFSPTYTFLATQLADKTYSMGLITGLGFQKGYNQSTGVCPATEGFCLGMISFRDTYVYDTTPPTLLTSYTESDWGTWDHTYGITNATAGSTGGYALRTTTPSVAIAANSYSGRSAAPWVDKAKATLTSTTSNAFGSSSGTVSITASSDGKVSGTITAIQPRVKSTNLTAETFTLALEAATIDSSGTASGVIRQINSGNASTTNVGRYTLMFAGADGKEVVGRFSIATTMGTAENRYYSGAFGAKRSAN